MSALDRLAATIEARKSADPDSSWTAKLLSGGTEACVEKFEEEAAEAAGAARNEGTENLIHEAADTLYHLIVMLTSRDVAFSDVVEELERREGTSGIEEKASRGKLPG